MIVALTPDGSSGQTYADAPCTACAGKHGKPLSTVVFVGEGDSKPVLVLCSECARDLANAIGFMALRDGWTKLEARKTRKT